MLTRNAFPVCAGACVCACVCVCVCLSSLQHFDMIKDKKYGLFKTYFYSYYISYIQSVDRKTIKSVTMLAQSGFWLKSVQLETSECSTLPRHVSH